MTNIRNLALSRINSRRIDNEKLKDYNLDVALKNKDIASSYAKCKQLQLDIARAQFEAKDDKSLKSKFKAEKIKLGKLLSKAGIDPNTLKPKFNCLLCHDTGIVDGHDCSCLKREISEILLEECGINKLNLPNFESIDYSIFGEYEKQTTDLYKLLKNYCNKLDTTNKKIITLMGQVGVGKTYLIECMVNECIKQDKYVIYTTAYNLNADMLKYHTSPMDKKSAYMDKYFDCDVLFVDDLGTETMLKNVTNEYLYQIISERMRHNKSTIFTTNLDQQQIINTYDERIFSRIVNKNCAIVLNMQGKDLRLNN